MKITEELLSVLENIENTPELQQGYFQHGLTITTNKEVTVYNAYWGLGRVFGAKWWVNIYTSYFFIYKSKFYWIARFDPMCSEPFEKYKFTIGVDSYYTYTVSDSNSMITKTVRHPIFKSNYIICTVIPDEFIGHRCSIKLDEQNGIKTRGDFVVFHDTESLERNDVDFQTLKSLLYQFENISIEQELKYFQKYPHYIKVAIDCLRKISNFKNCLEEDENYFCFKVPVTYDKKYYSASKIADSAKKIIASSDSQSYYVSFGKEQLEEIETMRFIINETDSNEDLKIRNYLNARSRIYQVIYSIQEYIDKYNEQHGYSSEITNCVLDRIIKNEKKKLQNRVDIIYSTIVSENRVPVKWTNEYRLFSIISSLVDDAVYQYRIKWLNNQSLDIYLTDSHVGIEYQGRQHYEAVEYFGGNKALINNQERDRRKRELCAANNVKLLEWSYTIPVNLYSVSNFLLKNNISIRSKEEIYIDSIMAPRIIKETTSVQGKNKKHT